MINNSTRAKWSNLLSNTYSSAEWTCIKVTLALFVGPGLIYTLFKRNGAPFPSGLCNIINCDLAFSFPFPWILGILIIAFLLLFVCEVKMLYTTLMLFLLSLLMYSIEESNGLKGRKGVLSLVFLAFFLAYLFDRINWSNALNRNRIQFPAQFIAAAYFLAAISKISASGLSWISESPFAALQILKSFDYVYFDTGLMAYHEHGYQMAMRIGENAIFIKVLFASAWILEMFAFVIMLNKRIAFLYALLLLAMHLGILFMMDIFFPTISVPLLIILINPLYLAYLSGLSVYNWLTEKFQPVTSN